MNNFQTEDFLTGYNELISEARNEQKGRFAVLASPTLNKQETITFLYKDVIDAAALDRPITGTVAEKVRNYLLFFPRLLYHFTYLVRISRQYRVKSLPKGAFFIRTWLIPRSFKKQKVRDDYFRQLIDDLRTEHNVIVGFQPLSYTPSLLKQFAEAEKHAYDIMLPGFLSIRDILSILVDYVVTARIHLKKEYNYKGRNISSLINRSLSLDYYRLRSFPAYIDKKIAAKVNVFEPACYLYIFENQAWENAYLATFDKKKTLRIGYQTSGFSLRFLNFFPSVIDKENSLFPDKIFTVGDSFKKIMETVGNFPIPVVTFAALRFEYPVVNNKYIVKYPDHAIRKRILYAFAVHVYQYPVIIKELVEVFADSGIEVHLKFHPLFNPDELAQGLPGNFITWEKPSDLPLKETYDFVLFNDNSFGIESLMEGVKSYEYKFGELYPETRLMNFTAYESEINKEKLLILKDELVSGTYRKKIDHDLLVEYVNQHYKPYSPELLSFFRG